MNQTQTTHRRDWKTVGREHTDGRRAELGGMFDRLEWHALPHTMGAMPGLAIQAAREQLRLPKVSAVALSNELAPYCLIGIECNYRNGRARLYLIDTGCFIRPLCVDFWKNEGSDGR